MSRKRSGYKPKGVRYDVMGWLQAGMRPARELPSVLTIRIKNHDAIDVIRKGQGKRGVFDVLIGAFNMSEALVSLGFGSEYEVEIRRGSMALLSAARRGLRTGSYVCTGPELTAINTAMEVHDAQLDVVVVADMERALDIVEEHMRNKKAVAINGTAEIQGK